MRESNKKQQPDGSYYHYYRVNLAFEARGKELIVGCQPRPSPSHSYKLSWHQRLLQFIRLHCLRLTWSAVAALAHRVAVFPHNALLLWLCRNTVHFVCGNWRKLRVYLFFFFIFFRFNERLWYFLYRNCLEMFVQLIGLMKTWGAYEHWSAYIIFQLFGSLYH